MVEASLKSRQTRRWRWLPSLLALLAVVFLLLMTRTGSVPQTRQLVTFVARGVLAVPPEHLDQVTLAAAGRTVTCVRTPAQGWIHANTQAVITGELLQHLEEAIRMMHTAGPVRVLHQDDYRGTDLHDFGLHRPLYSVSLAHGQGLVLTAHFGTYNPQDLLQYMQLTGSNDVYLMSRFVGQAWEHIFEHLMDQRLVP